MTGAVIDRAFAALELLAGRPDGTTLTEVAQRLEIPASATHRLLSDLVRLGYAHQEPASSAYTVTAKIVTLGYRWLRGRGLIAAVQPALQELADATGELVRYALVDGGRLAWVASAQGARFGLRLEPDMGETVVLHAAAAGQAWLACLSDEEALRLAMSQGFGRVGDHHSDTPRTIDGLQSALRLARSRGYAKAADTPIAGISAIAAPVRDKDAQAVMGVLDISGPTARLGETRLQALVHDLLAACADIAPLGDVLAYASSTSCGCALMRSRNSSTSTRVFSL